SPFSPVSHLAAILTEMPLIDPNDSRPIHFMGIAGAGMSALAELCRRRGATVTGCDQNPEGAPDLARLGIAVSRLHDAAHLDGHRALVVSSAIPKDHPEIARARAAGIPVVRRAEALAEATAGGTLVGVAGTHGKSTTTVMTTEALKSAGIDATGVVGARVTPWKGNLSPGADTVFVVEADEYDRSFLALSPDVAVVTNIEADHLDIYRDMLDIRGAFAQYVRGARWIVLCADDRYSNLVPTPQSAEVVRFGIGSPEARLLARAIETKDGRTSFDVRYDGKSAGRVQLGVVGEHNVRNALAALAVGLAAWGAPVEKMAAGLAAFAGADRRFQRIGDARGVTIVDDYAHHPTEIRATLSAARLTFPGRRIVVAFQPHLFSRTRDFAGEFGAALAKADQTFLADIYPAREHPIAGVTSQLIADAMAPAGRSAAWQGPRTELAAALAGAVREGDVVLTIGAGDITRTGPELLALLQPGS
ncbi:MAG: UDP-N-acetylmuramate--L-alanine ligase, partial [Gemmatimonadales bacterium]